MSEINEVPQLPEQPASPVTSAAPAATKKETVAWERDVLEKMLMFSQKEQRAARRWRIFFRVVTLLVIILVIWGAFFSGQSGNQKIGTHAALVKIDGVIDAGGENSASNIIDSLEDAFKADSAKGVILKINSPGGSPVQSGMVYDAIRRLREQYKDKPLYVVIEDTGASGGYYIAAAGDKIYANRASIVGSIGVLMDGFDLTGLMDKLGVQRRLLTAGENKGFMDPFSPSTPQQTAHIREMLQDIHSQFIKAVRDGRGNRLKETPDMFSGLVWTGDKAKQLGLIDDFGSIGSVAHDVLGVSDIVDYTQVGDLSQRVLRKFGVAIGKGVGATLIEQETMKLR